MQVLDEFLTIHGGKNGGPFLLGSQYSIAEVSTAPMLRGAAVLLPALRDYDVLAEAEKSGLTRFSEWAQVHSFACSYLPFNCAPQGLDKSMVEWECARLCRSLVLGYRYYHICHHSFPCFNSMFCVQDLCRTYYCELMDMKCPRCKPIMCSGVLTCQGFGE